MTLVLVSSYCGSLCTINQKIPIISSLFSLKTGVSGYVCKDLTWSFFILWRLMDSPFLRLNHTTRFFFNNRIVLPIPVCFSLYQKDKMYKRSWSGTSYSGSLMKGLPKESDIIWEGLFKGQYSQNSNIYFKIRI